MSSTTNLGHGLAKVLGIKVQYRQDNPYTDSVTRGESAFSVDTADSYIETEPTTLDWIRENTPSGRQILRYFYSLFPFVHWIGRYNAQWLAGDLVAGTSKPILFLPDTDDDDRYHRGRCSCPPKYGLCETSRTPC